MTTVDRPGAPPGGADVSVVASEPGKIFDREAMNAVRTWKYAPKVQGGQAGERPDLRVRLDFGMGEG